MKAILLSLLAWIASETEYRPPDGELPQVVIEDAIVIQNMFGNRHAKASAIYEPESNRIWLSADEDIHSPEGKSILVHELVHWLQDVAPLSRYYECGGMTEFEAFILQEEYMLQQRLESNVPWGFVYSFYTCPPPFAEDKLAHRIPGR